MPHQATTCATTAPPNSSEWFADSGTAGRTMPSFATRFPGSTTTQRSCTYSITAGRHFKVAGPLNVARTPQGAPVIVQAGASEQGRELAAATADVVYAAAQTLEAAQ